jgi:hypothetical protein
LPVLLGLSLRGQWIWQGQISKVFKCMKADIMVKLICLGSSLLGRTSV